MTDVWWRSSFSEEPVAGWWARAPTLCTQHPGYWRHISEIMVLLSTSLFMTVGKLGGVGLLVAETSQ